MSGAGVILALDLATVTGFTVGQVFGKPRSGVLRLPKTGEELGPFGAAYDAWLRAMIAQEQPGDVVYEEPMVDTAGKTPLVTSLKLKGLCFLTEVVCHQLKVRCSQMPAYQWKKAVCGTARVSKSMTPYPPIARLAERGIAIEDDNEADSYCIWLTAGGHLYPQAAKQVGALL